MRSKSPSDTAILIARSILLSASDPGLAPLLAPGEAEASRQMLGEKASGGWFGFMTSREWGRKSLMFAEWLLLGGIFAHYLARKRWIEKAVRSSIRKGIRQVVVVGAGYDSLAWRLRKEFGQVSFFEIDHPATQAAKREALGESPNLHFVAADLSAELPSAALIRCPDYHLHEPAVVIAEGVTMYFGKSRVLELIRSFAAISGSAGQVLFTFMAAGDDGSIHFRGENPAVGWWLRLRREPFRWGCRRTDLGAFLKACNLSVETIADHRDLRSGILAPRLVAREPLARGECLCLCNPEPS